MIMIAINAQTQGFKARQSTKNHKASAYEAFYEVKRNFL